MITTRKALALTAALPLLAFCAMPSSAANLVTNGSFEDPNVGSPGVSFFSSIPGWNLSSGDAIEVQNNVAGTAFDGQQLVELDSDASSGITQFVGVTAGQTYQLSFAFSARPGTPLSDNIMAVDFGGFSTTVSADGSALGDTSWTVYNFDVVAATNGEQLTFTDLGTSDGLGSYLDAVSVSRVPEPSQTATLAFGILGLGGLLLVARRRNSAQRSA